MRYQLQSFTRQQRAILEYILLEQMARQQWYTVQYLDLWKTEGLLPVQ